MLSILSAGISNIDVQSDQYNSARSLSYGGLAESLQSSAARELCNETLVISPTLVRYQVRGCVFIALDRLVYLTCISMGRV